MARSSASGSRCRRSLSHDVQGRPEKRALRAAKSVQSASHAARSGDFRNLSSSSPRRVAGVAQEVVPGLVEDALLPADHRREVHALLRKRRQILEGRDGKEPVLQQELRRDQQRIPGEGRGAAVGRAAAADRRQRQHLPQRLAGRLRPVEEPIHPRTEVADTERAGKRRGVKENSGGPGRRRRHEAGV